MLTREQKKQQVDGLTEKMGKIKSLILTDYRGVKVEEMREIRNKLREEDIEYFVIKNRLLKIVLEKQGVELGEIFKRPLALAFSYKDEVMPAKILSEAKKEVAALDILGGIYNGRYIDENEVMRLAKLPGRNELLAKIVGSINAPLSGMVNVLAGNMRGLVNVLKQYQGKIN